MVHRGELGTVMKEDVHDVTWEKEVDNRYQVVYACTLRLNPKVFFFLTVGKCVVGGWEGESWSGSDIVL
jgi:hypothetical protein